MGVVYKAEDTRLDRYVALKFLAQELTRDEESRKRFLREAKAAAGINHPNVCVVHEIGDLDGRDYLALEYIDGETLDARIEPGPLKVEDALGIARQVADGLVAAHEKNVVHRDIKPGNLMLTPDGRVKILDFGLALLTEKSKLTQLDTTVGTAAYMSPEQMQALEVDHRTDVWALGCVLYEMVAGRRAFRGEYAQAMAYEIVHEEPEPLTGLRTGVPMDLEFIVNKCLEKDPGKRYGRVADLGVDLGNLAEKIKSGRSRVSRSVPAAPATTDVRAAGSKELAPVENPLGKYHVIEGLDSVGDSVAFRAEDVQLKRSVTINVVPESAAREAERRRWRYRALVAALVMLIVALIGLRVRDLGEEQHTHVLRRFALTPEVGVRTSVLQHNTAISPNGRHIAFIAPQSRVLWVWDLDQQRPRAIDGTEGAGGPFWSPKSDFIGFRAGGELRKVTVTGGPSIRLCRAPGFFGATWSPDSEVIVFSMASEPEGFSLYEVPAHGGEPKLLLRPKDLEDELDMGGQGLGRPHFLPAHAGRRVLVFAAGNFSEQTLVVQDLETGRREILRSGTFPSYSPDGYLVYQASLLTQHDVWALPFSLETLRAEGEAFPVAENAVQPTVAADHTLVYLDSRRTDNGRLVWVDRSGAKLQEVGLSGRIQQPAISPDGRRVAVSLTEGENADVWVFDMVRGVKTRLTKAEEQDTRPSWSPDGDQISFMTWRSGNTDIFLRRADGSGEATPLLATPGSDVLSDWSRDGKLLLHNQANDIAWLEIEGDGSGRLRVQTMETSAREAVPKLSPDGRFVAYASRESGRFEVYVRPFPEGGGRVTVSTNGGTRIRWSRDGKELFYVQGETLFAVEVSTEGEFSIGKTTRLFDHPGLRPGFNYAPYDVSLDGKRFILVEPITETGEAPKPTIRVVENWAEEFRERGAEGR